MYDFILSSKRTCKSKQPYEVLSQNIVLQEKYKRSKIGKNVWDYRGSLRSRRVKKSTQKSFLHVVNDNFRPLSQKIIYFSIIISSFESKGDFVTKI